MRLNAGFWGLVGIASILTLARFSEAFLLLAAQHVGLATALTPGVFVIMNVAYAGAAYPFGLLSDRLSRRALLALGIVFLIAADLVLATARNSMAGNSWIGSMGTAYGRHSRLTINAGG